MNQRGQVYPLFGFFLLSMMALSALTIDMGYYRYQERLQQTATDSAAIAGGQASVFASPNAQNAALADASTNGFASPNATVSINPNYSDAYTAGSAGAVQVTITQSYGKWFSGFFGSGTQAVTTTAVVSLQEVGNACLTQLDPNGTLTLNGQKFGGAGCSLLANGTLNCHGGDYSSIAGITVNLTNNSGVSCKNGPTVTYTNTIPDPCVNVTGCLALETVDHGTLGTNCVPASGVSCVPSCNTPATSPPTGGTASPGCYSGVTFNKNVTFNPGLYTIVNGVTFQDGDLTSTSGTGGATFYIASGPMSVGTGNDTVGSSSQAFSGPSSGTYAGVLFYQNPQDSHAAGGDVVIGANLYTSGMWYFPTSDYTENGHNTHTYTGDVVFASITYNGSNTTNIYPGASGTANAPKLAKLVE